MKKTTFAVIATTALLAGLLHAAVFGQTSTTCSVRDPDLQGTYEGECIAGMASGKGRAAGKDRYEGGFRDGHTTGYGVYTRASGQRIEGEFSDGKLMGRAKIYYPNGDILEGLFEGGKLSGLGKLTPKTGTPFDIELRDGKLVRATGTSGRSDQPDTAPTDRSRAAASVKWAPRLDLEDLFPSWIIATATRQAVAAPATAQAPRGDPLSALSTVQQTAVGSPPTALPSNPKYLGDRWGLVGVAIRTTEPNAEVVVTIAIDEVAEPTTERFKLESPGDYLLYPKLHYKYDRLRAVTQPTPVNITWRLTVNGATVDSQMRTAMLRSIYDAPIQAQTLRGVEDLSWVFAAYVTEDAPWIDKLLQEALRQGHVRQFVGYQAGPQEAYRQVEAIYELLHRRGVRYSSITTSSQKSGRVSSQVVRFPLDSINNAQANCIDGTVLMASVLRKIGLDAYIILGPGHAMLGYSSTGNPQQGITVVETTMLGSARFSEAVRAGGARYTEWSANHRQDGQFKLIGINNARRNGVMPIPR